MNLSRILKTSTFALSISIISFWSSNLGAVEMPTPEVTKMCGADLRSERGAVLVEGWSTKPLPSEYRRAFGRWSLSPDETVEIWTVHRNSNGSSTIVVRTLSHEPDERGFLVMVKDTDRVLNTENVSAFEFAFSPREANGVTGLFFCDKHGPSKEWKWTGRGWD